MTQDCQKNTSDDSDQICESCGLVQTESLADRIKASISFNINHISNAKRKLQNVCRLFGIQPLVKFSGKDEATIVSRSRSLKRPFCVCGGGILSSRSNLHSTCSSDYIASA